jgi:hypothetical protein
MSRQASTLPWQINSGIATFAGLGMVVASALGLAAPAAAVVNAGGQVVCYSDRPCIELAAMQNDAIRIEWRALGSHDFFNVKWSRPGKDEPPMKVDGGYTGSLALTKVVPNTRYVIEVQGCDGQLWGGPVCTNWETQEIVTGVAVTPPTSENTPGDATPPGKPDNSPTSAAPANPSPSPTPKPSPTSNSLPVPSSRVEEQTPPR